MVEPEDNAEKQHNSNGWRLVIDFEEGALKFMKQKYIINGTHQEIQSLSDKFVKSIGKPIEDEYFDSEKHIYCGFCNKYYEPFCREHPLFHYYEKNPTNEESTTLTAAEKTLPRVLSIRSSKLPGAGNGVFSKIFIPSGVVFGPYEGVKLFNAEECVKEGYTWEVVGKFGSYFLDGSDPNQSNWIRYINCARRESEQNLFAFQNGGSIYYRVYRPIRIGGELLVWYGDKFGLDVIGQNTN
ncbi:unnamed protein product [Caenorhabditis nigoni]